MKKIIILLIVAAATLTLTALAEDATFETITEALNYTGNKNAVTKLIITGTIAGDDYSAGSEWREFFQIDKTFPNIEAVEILTDQDIPDPYKIGLSTLYGLFFYYDNNGLTSALWLKSFSAPNIKKIGSSAFTSCLNLISVDFPSATIIRSSAFSNCLSLISVDISSATIIEERAFSSCQSLLSLDIPSVAIIGDYAFSWCINLLSLDIPSVTIIRECVFLNCINLLSLDISSVTIIEIMAFMECINLLSLDIPSVAIIGDYAFQTCNSLSSICLGTELKEEAKIIFSNYVFFGVETGNIDLVLGEYVLPEPDLEARTWQDTKGNGTGIPYVWKSIKKYNSIKEILPHSISIIPNPATESTTLSLELETAANLRIILCDALGQEVMNVYNGYVDVGAFSYPINIKNLAKGVYFVKLIIDNESIVEKIIVN